jgi:hypothetical protein
VIFYFLFFLCRERDEDLIKEGEIDALGQQRLGSGYGNNGGCAKESEVHGVFSIADVNTKIPDAVF